MSIQFTGKIISSCDGGPCPGLLPTTDPAMVGVRGIKLPAADVAAAPGETAANETVILIPRSLLALWAQEES